MLISRRRLNFWGAEHQAASPAHRLGGSLRQTRPRSGGEARAGAFQDPRPPVLWLLYQPLVKAFAHWSRIAAPLLYQGPGSRRPPICGFFYDRLVTLLLAAGDPLGDVQREAENGLEFARKAKIGYAADIITG
jgi:hypothetical protein